MKITSTTVYVFQDSKTLAGTFDTFLLSMYIRTVSKLLALSFGIFDSILTGLDRNQMYGVGFSAQTAYEPV